MSKTYAIIGAGGWGTAVGVLLADKGIDTLMWGHDPDYAALMQKKRSNPKFLKGVRFPSKLRISSDPAEVLGEADVALSVVPTRWVRKTWTGLADLLPRGVPIVSLTKGIENGSLQRPTEILSTICPRHRLAVLSGPSHAEEVAKGMPTTVTIASSSQALRSDLQRDFTTERFRVYTNPDVIGVEVGGAMKNVVAIAAGIVDGLGFGDNTKAALLTRGLHEIAELGSALGGRRKTFLGMAGVGDLITTAFSPFGRNRAVGEKIGKGEKLEEILARTEMVAEGVGTTKSVHKLAKSLGVEMPITNEVYRVLFRGKDARRAVTELMNRARRGE